MPKKFAGENSKAVAARARKTEVKNAQEALKKKIQEDEEWKDDHKQTIKKQQKMEETERRKQEQLDKKAQVKALLEKEIDSIQTQGKQPLAKISRAQIIAETEKRNQMARQATVQKSEKKVVIQKVLEENTNRSMNDTEVAQTIDEAISILNVDDKETDRHPEKRMKAAYAEYEDLHLPKLKAEIPTLRLSQLKHLLFKQWQKSPENPMNQTHKS